MKKKGTLRIILILFSLVILGFVINKEYGIFEIDKKAPVISISHERIYNKNIDNIISISEEKGDITSVKLLFSSIDSNWKFIPFYVKKFKGDLQKNYMINLNKSDLKNLFSNNVEKFKIKVLAADSSFGSHNVGEKIYTMELDSIGPTIQVIEKSYRTVKDFSIFPFTLNMYDKNKISHFNIDNNDNFIIQKKKPFIYNILYFNKVIRNNFISIVSEDTVSNKSSNKLYFLKNIHERKNKKYVVNDKKLNILRKKDESLKKSDFLSSIKKILDKDLTVFEKVIYSFSNNKYNYVNNFQFFDFKYDDRFIVKPFNKGITYVMNKNKRISLLTNSTFYKINKFRKIYSIGEGVVVDKGKTKLLNDYIIVKQKNDFFSIHFFIKASTKVKIGDIVDSNTILGTPIYNYLFESNYGIKTYFKRIPFNPVIFMSPTNLKTSILNVFNTAGIKKELLVGNKVK